MTLPSDKNQPARSSVMLLALAGLGSALFTVMVTLAGYSLRTSEGLDFGVALAAYFVWYEGYRNSIKLIAFPLLIVFASMSSDTIEMPILFGWGCVGAFIVLAAGIFLFSPRSVTWKSLAMVSLWSLGGGVLGAIAIVPDAVLQHRNNYPWFLLIWQPGAAMMLGLLLERERRALPKPLLTSNS